MSTSSKLATAVYKRAMTAPGMRGVFWNWARQTLVRLADDPVCLLPVHGKDLHLRLSHDLPRYIAQVRFYDTLPGRLSCFVRGKHGPLVAIDVGANIGDTVASCQLQEHDRFLAVEPDPGFFALLSTNWNGNPNIRLVNIACSDGSMRGSLETHSHHGTAYIREAQEETSLQTATLDDLVEEHPDFLNANFIKIDTDGHDFSVIRGAVKLLTRQMPALMFECDSFNNPRFMEDCLGTLDALKACGYESFIVYSNNGTLMGKYPLSDLSSFHGLLLYQKTRKHFYYDVLTMCEEDAATFYETELEFFEGALSMKR